MPACLWTILVGPLPQATPWEAKFKPRRSDSKARTLLPAGKGLPAWHWGFPRSMPPTVSHTSVLPFCVLSALTSRSAVAQKTPASWNALPASSDSQPSLSETHALCCLFQKTFSAPFCPPSPRTQQESFLVLDSILGAPLLCHHTPHRWCFSFVHRVPNPFFAGCCSPWRQSPRRIQT